MSTSSNFEQRLFYGLLALLVWLPLPYATNRPWAEAIFEVAVVILAAFYLYGWRQNRVVPGAGFMSAKPVLWLLGVWSAYLLLLLLPLPISIRELLSPDSVIQYRAAGVEGAAPLSLVPYAGFMYWLKSVSYTLVFALVLLLVNSKQRLVILAYVLVLSGVFQAFFGSLMTLSGVEYLLFGKKEAYIGFATGTFVCRNHLAGYLEMVSAIGIGLLLASWAPDETIRTWKQRVRSWMRLLLSAKLLLRLMLAIMVIGLVLTRSRMGNTAFFSSMIVAGFIALLVFRLQAGSVKQMFAKRETRSMVILLSSLFVIDLILVGAWFGVEKLAARMEQTSVEHDLGRIEVSKNTLNLLSDYPLVGAGGGSFYTVYPRYRPPTYDAYYDHAHEDYLEIAADTGGIGLALLGSMVVLSFIAALLALMRRKDALMRGMAFASMMGIIALLIHSTVDFNLQIPANSATFMVVLALGWIALGLDSQGSIKQRIKTRSQRDS
ncbi:MAG: O-antigen ligase family protein [Sideroxydans sp.]|nr:O-antigen ligase family protein [Sideroxydans sp.]